MRMPGAEAVRSLIPVMRFARPHWRGFALAVFLMAFQSAASATRILIFMPVFNRLMDMGIAGPREPAGEADATLEAERARAMLKAYRERGGTVSRTLEGIVDVGNRWTSGFVPQRWIEDAADADAPEELRQAQMAVAVDRYATLLTVFAMFLLFILIMCAATYGESYISERVRLHMLMDVRHQLCRKLMDQPVAFYDQSQRGELIQRVLGDVEGYGVGIQLLLTGLIKGLLHIAVTLVGLAFLSWQLTLLVFLGLPFLLPMKRLFRRTLKRAHRRQQETVKRVEVLLQIFSGIRAVKAFGTEERRAGEFRASDEDVTRRSLKVQRAKSTMDALTEFINNFLAVLLAVGGGWLILRGVLPVTPVELMIFFGLVANLYHPVKRLVKQTGALQDSMASIQRTTEYLVLESGVQDAPDAIPFPGLERGIRFEHVGFAYEPGRPVLEDVSFEVPKGATVALVGPSGSGKSTLCDLLLRFYDPVQGKITIDGVDARRFRRASLLRRTAVVTQEPFLFHTTVGENIRQGKVGATQEEVEAAARAAQIHEHIASQPEAYDAIVGEQGVRLSGGQRQRITIARALVRDPQILVLDEATSSLDTASERAVQEALERLQAGRTTLVVAHRLSTVRHADRIVVLQGGRIVDQGTHDELLTRGGLYAELVRMQDLGSGRAEAGATELE